MAEIQPSGASFGIGVDPTVFDGLVKLTRVGNVLVYNAALGDTDFRIAGDTDANLLVANAGDNSVTVGIAASAMGVKFAVSDGTDEIGFDLDGTNVRLNWNDGALIVETKEANTNSIVDVRGAGTGYSIIRLRDEDEAEYLEMSCIGGAGRVAVVGSSPAGLRLQQDAATEINCFLGAAGAERPKFKIYGRDQATDLKNLQIGMSSAAADTVDFTNVGIYNFDGLVSMTGDLLVEGEVQPLTLANSASAITRGVYVVSNTLAYTDTAPKTIASLPGNTVLLDIYARITTSFDGAGAGIHVGFGGGATDAFLDTGSGAVAMYGDDVATRGASLWDGTSSQRFVRSSAVSILGQSQGAGASQGAATIYLVYQKLS